MSEIKRSPDWNPGGGNWMEMVPAAWVATYSRASPSAAPVITLQPGREWLLIYCTQGTLQYKEDAATTDNGRLYTVEVKGFSPADNVAKRTTLEGVFGYEKVLVRFRDNARITRLAGTKTEPLTLAYTLNTSADVASQRGYDLDLKGTLTAPAAYE